MMRRLQDHEHQRAGAEQELRNFRSQVHGHKQEQEEHDNVKQQDGKVYDSSDLKIEKSDKRQEQVRQDISNMQNSAGRQNVQKRAAQSAAKQGSSRSHSWSDWLVFGIYR